MRQEVKETVDTLKKGISDLSTENRELKQTLLDLSHHNLEMKQVLLQLRSQNIMMTSEWSDTYTYKN